eukprot:TRINITY_DN2920_c0_g1_i1.p1 TRINITY_DN2920_c0_g1~~TRINITY_DN2920_c0_g1_i1.p1  ORF type:complete len:164 (-),score=1.27 TRINITY_DN2920_c0_g1_i1:113-604(-)
MTTPIPLILYLNPLLIHCNGTAIHAANCPRSPTLSSAKVMGRGVYSADVGWVQWNVGELGNMLSITLSSRSSPISASSLTSITVPTSIPPTLQNAPIFTNFYNYSPNTPQIAPLPDFMPSKCPNTRHIASTQNTIVSNFTHLRQNHSSHSESHQLQSSTLVNM